ncbi:MAG: oxidoreductase C-terminal domain-containing protein, partial [Cellulomonas sp.]
RHAPVGGSWRVRVVGDAARRRSARHGWVPGGHWDAALRGPAVAVAGLLGREAAESDLAPYVFSTQLGHELALYGLPGAGDDVVLRGDPAGDEGWTALWFAPGGPEGTGTLTAVFAVDRPRDVGAARRLLAGVALPVLDRARAADPAVPLARALAG